MASLASRPAIVLCVAVALAVGACVSAPSASPAPLTPALTASPPPSLTPTALPSPSEQWGVVLLGDSTLQGVFTAYPSLVEQDNDVAVVPYPGIYEGATSGQFLSTLQSDAALRSAIRGARIIVLILPAGTVRQCIPQMTGGTEAEIDACLGPVVEKYGADAEAVFAELVALRSPSEAAIRALDLYQFGYAALVDAGTYSFVKPWWQRMNAALIGAAERYGIPVARLYDAFMGPDGGADPVAGGWVFDDTHPTTAGSARMAELLRALGYEPSASQP